MRCFCAHVKGRRKISLVLSLLIGFILIAGAALAVPVPVLALSAGGIKGTIASIILSLLLQTGVAPTDATWLNQLNSAYGASSTIGTIEDCISSGLLTETSSGLVDSGLSTAISNLPEYTSLGLDELFSTTVSDIGTSPASAATNLTNTAINVGTMGNIGAFAGAVSVGVGVGVLINKAYNFLNRWIAAGMPISYGRPPAAARPEGYENLVFVNYKHFGVMTQDFILYNDNTRAIGWANTRNDYGFFLYSTNQSRVSIYKWNDTGWIFLPNYINPYEYHSNTNDNRDQLDYMDPLPQMTNSEARAYIQSIYNGTQSIPEIKKPVSPDIITPQGNAQIIQGPNGTNIISGQGNIVPDGYDMAPVDVEDYLNFAEQANENTQNGDIGQNIQGEAFDDFVDPYLVPPHQEPDEPIIPENPDDIPEYPDRPVTPEQPTIPDKPEIPDEDIETNLDLTATPDLRGIFPFCIPWDIYNLVLIFDTGENRQAPHITFTFPGTDWVIDVDLAEFDPVAGLLRLLELILFVVGLMVATRSLIGAGG